VRCNRGGFREVYDLIILCRLIVQDVFERWLFVTDKNGSKEVSYEKVVLFDRNN
jgi:hypothetical protein